MPQLDSGCCRSSSLSSPTSDDVAITLPGTDSGPLLSHLRISMPYAHKQCYEEQRASFLSKNGFEQLEMDQKA